LLSELPAEVGYVKLFGTAAYVAQEAFFLPETIQNNILFGLDYDKNWYQTVVEACALEFDLQSLPSGDQTVVGEKGANLSGGQRARINLARYVPGLNRPIPCTKAPRNSNCEKKYNRENVVRRQFKLALFHLHIPH